MPKTINLISIAENAIEQERGLKHVHYLPSDVGMLFKFQSPKILSFWMSETPLCLEIGFIDHEGTIVKTERMIPLSTRSVTSGRPCVMDLEVPAGTFENMGGVVGRKIVVDAENKTVTIND